MSVRQERWYPVAVGLLAGIIYFILWRHRTPPDHWPELLGAAISVNSIAVGFFATAKATISSDQDRERERPIVRKLRDVGKYDLLVDYIVAAINWSFAVAGISAAMLLIDFSEQDTLHRAAFAVWVALAVAAAGTYHRAVRVIAVLDRQKRRKPKGADGSASGPTATE